MTNSTPVAGSAEPGTTLTAEKEISPKVIASAAVGGFLTIIVAGIAAITPELFAALGAWGPVAYAAVVAGGTYLAGYLVRDPLRR